MGGSTGKIVGRGLLAGATGGLSEFAQNNPFGGPGGNPLNPIAANATKHLGISLFGNPEGTSNPYVSGPFSLDPNQYQGDMNSINALGEKQYQETLQGIPQEVSNAIQQENPSIMENLNSNGLLTSSAYPQEIARQQSYLTQNLVQPAVQGRQQFQTGALQRGQSLEDFINQANVAKTIGAQMAPQPPNGKQNFGTVAQGVGAIGTPLAKLATK